MAKHADRRIPDAARVLRIGDVAQRVGLSPTALRTWERVGLISPGRSAGRYRLYSLQDVRFLQRACYLRRRRGLNPAAIAHLLRSRGALRPVAARRENAVGTRLRRLRLARKMSLRAVAREVEISAGFLSAIERGQMSASVATMRRLARFFQTNILEFFDVDSTNPRRVRPADRKVLAAGPGVRMELLAWGNKVMEPHLFRIAPGRGSGDAYDHEGEEFLYLLRGTLEISLGDGSTFRLEAGDSFYFESSSAHRWTNPGRCETLVLWVNTPPTF